LTILLLEFLSHFIHIFIRHVFQILQLFSGHALHRRVTFIMGGIGSLLEVLAKSFIK